ncbi:hypothetical protein KFE26_20185 [Shewanella sp. M16]|uniref:hypothetical protein n=1 Tax=unclassified Shewanella TaxID=196818 RepID=UPI001BB0CA13|nr:MULTISPECIES: hypothetical protein [unclassified Shewanella]MBS0044593.1 hypothetical protein [Shewanella sp. M16]MCU8082360.1 hypothetical protein [Shewanella sp. SM23]
MAKSRLAASRNQNKLPTPPITKNNVTSLDLNVDIRPEGKLNSTKHNFLYWCHEQCDPKKPLAKPSRLEKMQKLKRWVDQEKKNETNAWSLVVKLSALKAYIAFCDIKKFAPFSQAGYLSYAGNSGELRRLVDIANEPKKYQFQYHNGEEFGLLEFSALQKKMNLDSLLPILGFDVSDMQATLKSFNGEIVDFATQPYTSREWYALVRRTQLLFFSLATQLIAYKEENPDSPPPQHLDNIVVERKDNRDITITLGRKNCSALDGLASPFNQCMAAAYTLFAYYTAFNDSVIRQVRHPIKFVTPNKDGRTSKVAQVRAYKGRASKDVKALFSGTEENSHPEAKDDEAGFIVADINKRDSVGEADGITFLRALELLSKTYSEDPYDTLIYFLNSEGDKGKVDVSGASFQLSKNLNLLSESRADLIDHLVKTYTDIVEDQKMTTFNKIKRDDGVHTMESNVTVLNKQVVTIRTMPIAYAALSCMTDVSLRNALIPLNYSEKDFDGAITVSFKYADGSLGEFIIAAKYRHFLQLVERYAATRNPLPRKNYGFGGGSSTTRLPYLLPLGGKHVTYQWSEGEVPIRKILLNLCGIGRGDYFLNITASRIRITHSNLEYKAEEKGWTARKILQHNIETTERHYPNGHPVSNNRQMSQGMMGLVYIAQGKSRSEAIESVKKELEIPILEYDVWKQRNAPTNPNGISCDGEIDSVSEKDWHYAARKFAEKKGIIEEGQDITCYQYDLCVFCRSAKLVDDPYAIYKLLSFLDALSEAIDQYPERASVIQLKINRFQANLDGLPLETIEQAEYLLEEKGRYPLFNSLSSISQFL